MSDIIIKIDKLTKTYSVIERTKTGLWNSFKSLFKREYKSVEAVKGISLEIKNGEVYGFIGPNGAGKSTTIKMISGVLTPTSGESKIMGFTPWKERVKYVENIGVLFGQKTQLFWDLPAIESFELAKEIYSIPDDIYRENLDFFIEVLKLKEVIGKPVRQLSLGERMKCEFCYVMLHNPPVVFLDEPTIGLDIISRDAIREFIKKVNRERQTTFIVTTHDLSDIEDLCQNLCIINHGDIVYNGTIHDLKKYSSDLKRIELNSTDEIDYNLLKDFKLIEKSKFKAIIEINITEKSLKDVMKIIFDETGIHDINVNNIPIEEVIKRIYHKG